MKFIRFTHEIVWDVLLETIVDIPFRFIRFTHEIVWDVFFGKESRYSFLFHSFYS
jgi:DNA primase